MNIKIVTNKRKLRVPTSRCESIDEGMDIAEKLIQVLETTTGIGLSANQIGIPKSVCVVKARKDSSPMILINPVCRDASVEKVVYYEGCLSLPGKTVKTVRHQSVTVECDNWENEMTFCPDNELTKDGYWKDEGLLECICVQHEMGHLEGSLITDVGVKFQSKPMNSRRIGRNDSVMIKKGDKTQMMKYKKAENLLKDGWEII